MNSSDRVSPISRFFHAISHPFRSPVEAAQISSDDSSSTDTTSPLEIFSDPSQSPEAAILSAAGYQMFRNNVQEGIQLSTSEFIIKGFMSRFQDAIASCERNGLLSLISTIANDLHKSNDEIIRLYQTWNQGSVLDSVSTRQFFQNIGSDLSTFTLQKEKQKLTRELRKISEQRTKYLEFVSEVLLLVYRYVYKPSDQLLRENDEKLFRVLIQIKLLASDLKEPEGKSPGCLELYSTLTVKLYYRNEVSTYISLCSECEDTLGTAIKTFLTSRRISTLWPAEVLAAIGFIRSVPAEDQAAVISLFLKNLDGIREGTLRS